MAYDYAKLNGKIAEVCGSQSAFAKRMELSERSVSLKLNNLRGWKQAEIQKAAEILGISQQDIQNYFFALKVQ